MLTKRNMILTGMAILAPLPARAAPVAVPLSFDDRNRPCLDATINGHGPYRFLFSTGAFTNTLNWNVADSLGLKRVGKVRDALLGNQSVSPGRIDASRDYVADEVVLGGVYRMTDVGFSGYAPSHPEDDTNLSKRKGIMGSPLVTGDPCLIDFDNNQILFYPGAAPDTTGFAPAQTQIWRSAKPFADLEIDITLRHGGEALKCIMDTAGEAELYLASKHVKALGLYGGLTAGDYVERPLDWDHPERGTIRVIRVRDFSLAGAHFDIINVWLGDPENNDKLDEIDVTAVVSGLMLRQFNIAFNGRGKVLMKPNSRFKAVSDPLPAKPVTP